MSIKKNPHPWEHKFRKERIEKVKCPTCNGRGWREYLWVFTVGCSTCKGKGLVEKK